jgi:polar amino acid transport system substrate-binding protein
VLRSIARILSPELNNPIDCQQPERPFMKTILPRYVGLLFSLLALSACHPDRLMIEHLDDANHATIGVLTGSTGEAIAAHRFPEATLLHFDDILDAAAATNATQLDTFLTADLTAIQLVKKNKGLKILNEPLSNEHLAIGVRKGNDQLLTAVNAALTEMRSDGTLASMDSRWLQPGTTTYDAPTLTTPTTGTPLKVGVAATREPLIFVDGEGRISGHDAEMMRRVAIKLNRPIEFVDMKFMALIQSLQAGKIDLIGGGMAASDERKKSINFSDPYVDIHQVLVVPSGVAADKPAARRLITSASDLHGRKIAVQIGTAYVPYVTTNYPDATALQYQSAADVVMAIKSGKAEVSLADVESLKEIFKAEPTFAPIGDPVFSFPVGIGFNKEAAALKQQFNAFLKTIRDNGVYDNMKNRWLQSQDIAAPPMPPVTGKTELVAGVAVVGLPYISVKDNELVGFDIELTQRFAASINRPIRYSNMEFSSLVAAVSTNKVDLIASSIFITEERQKKIDFSDAYDEQAVRVYALKENIAGADGTALSAPTETKRPGYFARVAESFESNILLEKRYLLIWDGLKTTVIISILATLFGTALGGLVCYMRMSANAWLRHPASVYISILRGTPVLVLLMVIFYIVFASVSISPVLVAVIAFGMNFAAYFAEIFRSGVSSLDRGQTEAGIAMGFTETRTFLNIVLPQTIVRILPVYKGEFISLVKMTSIVGYIAVQDLTKASDIIRSRTFDAFFPLLMIAVLYFLISGALLQALNYLERITDPKTKRRKAGAV